MVYQKINVGRIVSRKVSNTRDTYQTIRITTTLTGLKRDV